MKKRFDRSLLGRFIIYFILISVFTFCKKSSYLDAKPDQSLIIPETIEELQSVLDNTIILNGDRSGQRGVNPAFGEVAAGDFYVPSNLFSGSTGPSYKNLYTWQFDNTERAYYDWAYPYRAIFYANIALNGLKKIIKEEENEPAYNNVMGSALFIRAQLFFQLAQVFSSHYNQSSANTDPGIVLKLDADINEPIKRSSVKETYQQIFSDLHLAKEILPVNPIYKTRPSKIAALAQLARTHLIIQDYDSAYYYVQEALLLHNTLMDFNNLNWVNPSAAFPIKQYNPEVIFHSCLVQTNIALLLGPSRLRVDSTLYSYYEANDIRKRAFFATQALGYSFKGSYDGSATFFGGISSNELYLIRAECHARGGRTTESMKDLNYLLRHRYVTNSFTDLSASTAQEALGIILKERRKELLFRGLRWTDLRRLNAEGANITLKRIIDGVEYTLPPNDPRYTFLIPPDVIGFHPNMPQNPR